MNQLVLTTYSDGSTVVNTYTITGQIETVTEVAGLTRYTYDVQDRLKRIDYPTGQYIEYQYDLNGNRTQVKTANQTVDYTFDELNRLETVTDASGVTTYTYDPVGNRATQLNSNGTLTTYSYDDLNRLELLVHTDVVGNTLASYDYELWPNGNRRSITEATGRVVEYTYDDLYRLETETVTDPINGNHFSQWSYDAVGNRLQQDIDGVVTTYTYNDNDHLLTETENGVVTSYVYDDNGNTLEKVVDGLVDTTYSYSKDNRMLSADTSTSSISYTYDAGGFRQSQTVDGIVTNYLVDPNRSYHQVLEEQDDLFIPQVVYTYGDDLISQTNSQGSHTFGYDGLGSTRILTDSVGVVQNSYGYQAFGELDYQHGIVDNSYLFTGEQYDNNVGFYYLRARFYNPEIGRFQNMDVFPGTDADPKSLHKYLYTANDPINGIDPSGYSTLVEFGAANAGRAALLSFAVTAPTILLYEAAKNSKSRRIADREIAKQCAKRHAGTAVSGSICENSSVPILFHSAARMPAIYSHVRASQASGRPALLGRTLIAKNRNRRNAIKRCKTGIGQFKPDLGGSCDEYPFASTFQGGVGASVQKVPLYEQWIQGGTISSFYAWCGIVPEIAPFNEFVVIPVVSVNPAKSFQCGIFR